MRPFSTEFQVFFSYGRPDMRAVHNIHATLRSHGISGWMDVENISAGEDWRSSIKSAMRGSQLVLVFLSRRVIAREGHLQEEIQYALEIQRRKPPGATFIVPVGLDDCPIHPWLERFHCIRLSTSDDLHRLIQQIQEVRRGRWATGVVS